MKKVQCTPRSNWEKKCDKLGFYYHSVDNKYWIEDYAFEFEQEEINKLEKAAQEIHFMCLDLVEEVVQKGSYDRYGISPHLFEDIEKSWEAKEFDLYSRFDFSYTTGEIPKLLEYNADTPTAIVESGEVLKEWQLEQFPNSSQFNNLTSLLIERFSVWRTLNKNQILYFSADNRSEEDWCSVEFIRSCANRAGIETYFIDLQDIGWDHYQNKFVGSDNKIIDNLFKLHPWEDLVKEPLYPYVNESKIKFIEPMWKMLISNKAILPLLWEKFPHHPNLLPAFFTEKEMIDYGTNYVCKPLLSREGANIVIYENGQIIDRGEGIYGCEGHIYQERKDVACFDGRYSTIGLWMVADKPAGLSIREDSTIITKNSSWFIPHYIK